jgi:hypothetical protein
MAAMSGDESMSSNHFVTEKNSCCHRIKDYNVPLPEVSRELRRNAKTVNSVSFTAYQLSVFRND